MTRPHINGDKHRAAITQILLEAGPEGIKAKDIQPLVKLGAAAVSYYLTTLHSAVQAATRRHWMIRWYHRDFAADAAEYVAKVNAQVTPRKRWSDATEEAVVEAIVAAGEDGIPRLHLVHRFGMNDNTIGALCIALEKAGRIKRRLGPGTVVTCFGPDINVPARLPHSPKTKTKAARAQRAAMPKPSKQARTADKPIRPMKKSTLPAASRAWKGDGLRGGDFEPIYTGRERKIIAPPPKSRFQVDSPTPFFSAMRPGQYPMPATCNAARVLSGV